MPKLLEQLTTDLSAGMYDSVAPTAYPNTAAAQILNGRIQPDGTVRRRSGSIRTHPTTLASGTGYGGIAYTEADGTQHLVVFVGTTAHESQDSGATWTSIATGLRADYYTFAIMRVGAVTYLYAANGDTTIKSWDGTTWTTLANAPSGVKFIAPFNGRLWATGHSGVLVQASKIADPATWASPDGITVQIQQIPTGLVQIGTHLLVFDRSSTSYIDGYGEQTLVVQSGDTGFSKSVGCVGFRTIAPVGDSAVCWLSERGVEYYQTGSGITLLSNPVQRFFDDLDWNGIYSGPGEPSAVYDALNQDYHCALSTDGLRNDRVLVLNLIQNKQYQRSGPRSAASIDQPGSAATGLGLLFGDDGDGYLGITDPGQQFSSDAQGYVKLVDVGELLGEDASGYIESATDDTFPSTLFIGPSADRLSAVYSVGYDGFVRLHAGVDKDDLTSAGAGGNDVTMTILSRPFLFRRPRAQKRARFVHVSSLQENAATLSIRVRGTAGDTTATRTVSVAATTSDKTRRVKKSVHMLGDAPQVEIKTTDDVRISLIGLSAEMLRESV